MAQPLRLVLSKGLRSSQPARLVPPEAAWPSVPQARRLCSSASQDTSPPFLAKLKAELKSAMRAKDAPRLSVLRAIMSANLNASKTAAPVRTDVQVVALIRKIQSAAEEAVTEAKAAGRDDIVANEGQQIAIMREYLANSGIECPDEAKLQALVDEAVAASCSSGIAPQAQMGDVMKRLAVVLEGMDVDKKQVAWMVKKLTGK